MTTRLSKSRYLSGLQCPKRLYLEIHNRELARPVDEGTQAILDAGTRVGELARDRYPGGVLVDVDYLKVEEGLARTAALLAEPAVRVLYEGFIAFEDVVVRPDILVRTGENRWRLIEVKSTASAKVEHRDDLAIQVYVVTGAGLTLDDACLMHINTGYLKWPDPEFRFPKGLFFKEDETRVKWLRPEQELLAFATVRTTVRIGPKRGTRPVPFRDMSRLAAITLMRLTEIRTLRREHVDLTQGVVTLPRTKTELRHVVLNQEAQDILKRVLEGHASEWVFPNHDNRPYSRVHVGREWRKASRAVGLTDFHFHDLRHHGATQALNAGFSGPIVQALGGWKSEKMMRRYAAVTDKTLRAAAEAVSGNRVLLSEVGARPRVSETGRINAFR
jgi:hypothetical protein